MRSWLLSVLLVAGCGASPGDRMDAGDTDAGSDAAVDVDSGPPPADAGEDAGTDASPPDDAGGIDAGDTDAGTDAGADAGGTDAGTDAGTPDAGFDAGPGVGQRSVFVTGAPFLNGNLGGLAGADAICNARASAVGLAGTYMAWLSTDSVSPSTRFTQASVPYVRTDGVRIAADWTDLIDGSLDAPINVLADGTAVGSGGNVWTRTEVDGTPRVVFDCRDWTTSGPSENGMIGNILYDDARWTALGAMACGSRVYRLYCFEQ